MRQADHRSNREPNLSSPEIRSALDRYWRTNLRITRVLLAVWAIAGIGFGILFADRLNLIQIGGFPLGFWFAQQGSIVVFVVLILTYALLMNRLDAKHHKELVALSRGDDAPADDTNRPPDPGQETGSG